VKEKVEREVENNMKTAVQKMQYVQRELLKKIKMKEEELVSRGEGPILNI